MKNHNRNIFTLLIVIGIGIITFFASSCKKDEIVKKDPIINWSDPENITIGTILSDTQLNAKANVEGTYVYTPPIGTTLPSGAHHNLRVDFTPTDLSAYNKVGKTVKLNVLDIQMVNIPAGTFTMGSPEAEGWTDETQHQVTLSAFRMSKYEITNAQYADFLNAKSIGADRLYAESENPGGELIYESVGSNDQGLHYNNYKWEPVAGYENHPVIYVTWYGATEFAIYASGTLPTEAQWEYACRAGTTTPFNTGDYLTNLQANYKWEAPYHDGTNSVTTSSGKTQAVGTYSANAWGLHDMHGNVKEWCSDWLGTYPTRVQTDPTGPKSGELRVMRGGSCWSEAWGCRSAVRQSGKPGNYISPTVGFRIVLAP